MATTEAITAGRIERVCLCGCQASLEGRSPNARYSKPCVLLRENARRKTKDARLRDKKRKKRHSKIVEEQRKSVDHGAHHVVGRRDPGDPERVPQKLCEVCLGMSWRREARCAGCDELFDLEPRPEGLSVIQSNMATVVREGRLFGYAGHRGTQHAKK
jgi:hypothetical protein